MTKLVRSMGLDSLFGLEAEKDKIATNALKEVLSRGNGMDYYRALQTIQKAHFPKQYEGFFPNISFDSKSPLAILLE